jgi:hypothetical protein
MKRIFARSVRGLFFCLTGAMLVGALGHTLVVGGLDRLSALLFHANDVG